MLSCLCPVLASQAGQPPWKRDRELCCDSSLTLCCHLLISVLQAAAPWRSGGMGLAFWALRGVLFVLGGLHASLVLLSFCVELWQG